MLNIIIPLICLPIAFINPFAAQCIAIPWLLWLAIGHIINDRW